MSQNMSWRRGYRVHFTPLTRINKLLKRRISSIALVPPYNGNNFQLRDDADWDAPCNEPVFLDELWGEKLIPGTE
jgi:hypothetical protein